MSFKEDFPSLKKACMIKTPVISGSFNSFEYVDSIKTKDIQEHCLDKQRVKEIITEHFEKHCGKDEVLCCVDFKTKKAFRCDEAILEELGL